MTAASDAPCQRRHAVSQKRSRKASSPTLKGGAELPRPITFDDAVRTVQPSPSLSLERALANGTERRRYCNVLNRKRLSV